MSTILALALLTAADARPQTGLDQTIARVEQMVSDPSARALAAEQGLSVVNVTWEDTGRSKNSSWGPNISDMTIGVRDSGGLLHPMPVLRFDNFSDVTADLPASRFRMLTGNEAGADLEAVNLSQILRNPRAFLHDSGSWSGDERSLWSGRDHHVLVSAQAAFLPVPRHGEATFTPVIYNYQSSPGNPAVLTIVATREGTSMQVVENDSGYMSEPLFFNADGERAPFTAQRLSDWTGDDGRLGAPEQRVRDGMHNVVLVAQVPLKQRAVERGLGGWMDDMMMEGAAMPMAMQRSASDVEDAVIGHGETEGPYEEIGGLDIERDARFPVRVTVQFYQATSNGIIDRQDVAKVRGLIDRVYADADFVGSLVTAGDTGRPTEWVDQSKAQWADWGWFRAF